MHIYLLDLIGTFAFAVFGAHKALSKGLNIYGIVTCAALTALGGGTIRQLLLRQSPVYFSNYTYVYVMFAGVLFAWVLRERFHGIKRYMLVLDAVGLSTFACIGAQKAGSAGLGLVAEVFFAVLTATGGGILADIVANEHPQSFGKDFYILPGVLGGGLYWLLTKYLPVGVVIAASLAVPFVARIGWLARKRILSISLPKFEMSSLAELQSPWELL